MLKQLLGAVLGRQRGAADGRPGDCGCVFEDSVGQGEGTEYVCSEVLGLICEKISAFRNQISFVSALPSSSAQQSITDARKRGGVFLPDL